jgi:hypothetical protein
MSIFVIYFTRLAPKMEQAQPNPARGGNVLTVKPARLPVHLPNQVAVAPDAYLHSAILVGVAVYEG